MVLTFESVNEILNCNHSNKSCSAVFSLGSISAAVSRVRSLFLPEKNLCARFTGYFSACVCFSTVAEQSTKSIFLLDCEQSLSK